MTMTAKGLAKLIEETGELQQVMGKKLAFFYTNIHPDGAGGLSERLGNEIADVMAACDFVRILNFTQVENLAIDARRELKLSLFLKWEADPNNNRAGIDRG